MLIGMAGSIYAPDGVERRARLGQFADVLTNVGGALYELARRGLLWAAQTAVTGVPPGTAIGTTAAAALYNPLGSPVDLIVVGAQLGYVSGTIGAGVLSWCAHDDPNQAAITGTAMVAVAGRMDLNKPNAKALTTATVPSGGKAFRTLCSLGAHLASTVVQPWQVVDEVLGAIVIPPGYGVSLQATAAAGTTPLVAIGLQWAEVPAGIK